MATEWLPVGCTLGEWRQVDDKLRVWVLCKNGFSFLLFFLLCVMLGGSRLFAVFVLRFGGAVL